MAPKPAAAVQGFYTTLTLDEIVTQLNSKETTETMDGMRNLVGLMSHGVEVDAALPHVIKLVIQPDLAMRRYVYQFLAHFSESNPAQALMAVNILQRALSDKNALVRGMALRALSSIRVREIAEVARLSIEQHVLDESPFVRRIAALGINKLYSFCPEFKADLRKLLERALDDSVPMVLGAALQTFEMAFSDDWDLFHPTFHKLCSMLHELDQFEQVNALQLLTRYVRENFADARYKQDEEINMDLHAAYKAAGMLLRAGSPAVVLEASQFLFHCSPAFERIFEINLVARSVAHAVAVSLVRVLSAPFTVSQTPILATIRMIAEKYPQYFNTHYKEFYLKFGEPLNEKLIKLQILSSVAGSLTDTDQDMLLNELKTYVTYSLSQVYVEQQEITVLVIRVISKIVEVKALSSLQNAKEKLDDFADYYWSLLMNPITRVAKNKTEIAFANDVVFQQSVIEVCTLLYKLHEIDAACNTQCVEQIGNVLVSKNQIYIDPEADEKQDKKYPIPKASWPSSLGFEPRFDPLLIEDEHHSENLNKKSFLQHTKLSIFIQEQIRVIISAYSVSHQLSQNFECVKMRAAIIQTVKQLRYYCAPFVAEFLRMIVIRITDEPFEIKQCCLQIYSEIFSDLETFRAAPVYLKQRRIIQDSKRIGEDLDKVMISRYNGQVPTMMTAEQIAEEIGNFDYTIRQMNDYLIKTLQLDHSYVMRDLATMQYFAGFQNEIFALTTDFTECTAIMATMSQVLGFKVANHRPLSKFAKEDTPSSLREALRVVNQIASGPHEQISFVKKEDPKDNIVKGEETGIRVSGKVDVDAFLQQGQRKPVVQNDDDEYYYSDEEEQVQQQRPQKAKLNTAAIQKPEVVAPKPAIAPVTVTKVAPAVKPAPKPVAPAPPKQPEKPAAEKPQAPAKPAAPKAPAVPAAPKVAAPPAPKVPAAPVAPKVPAAPAVPARPAAPQQPGKPAAPQAAPAQAQKNDDLLSLFGDAPVQQPVQQAKPTPQAAPKPVAAPVKPAGPAAPVKPAAPAAPKAAAPQAQKPAGQQAPANDILSMLFQ